MTPTEVAEALERMRVGDASADVLATVVAGAEAFATLVPEYVFASPQAGLFYATQNDMLAEVMSSAKPGERVLVRFAPPAPSSPDAEENE